MRHRGYYWVTFDGIEMVAYYNGENWLITGHTFPLWDTDFSEIDENRILWGSEIIELPKNRP